MPIVRDFMTRQVVTTEPSLTALEAAKLMDDKKVEYVIVVSEGRAQGIVTENDMVRKVIAVQWDPSRVRVEEIMSSPLISIDPDAQVRDAVKLMMEKGIRRLAVIEKGTLLGVLNATTLTWSIFGSIAREKVTYPQG